MKVRLVFACAAAGIAFTAFAATPASATGPLVGEVAVVASQPPPAEPPTSGQPSPEPPPSAEPPTSGQPAPQPPPGEEAPPQVSPKPEGAPDTGSLDPAPSQGPDAGVVVLGGVALVAAGGLGITAFRRRQRA